jgi:hypothetical protein
MFIGYDLLPLVAVRTWCCILNTCCSDISKFLNLVKNCHNPSWLQEGNVKNQREHIVHLLANEQSRLGKLSANEPVHVLFFVYFFLSFFFSFSFSVRFTFLLGFMQALAGTCGFICSLRPTSTCLGLKVLVFVCFWIWLMPTRNPSHKGSAALLQFPHTLFENSTIYDWHFIVYNNLVLCWYPIFCHVDICFCFWISTVQTYVSLLVWFSLWHWMNSFFLSPFFVIRLFQT